MTSAWTTVALALGGCLVGALGGWAIGRAYRERPVKALFAILMGFAGGCYAVWLAAKTGDARISTVGIGAAFGVMTGVKYSSGLIPGLAGMPTKSGSVTGTAGPDHEPDHEPDDARESSEEAA